MLCIRLDIIEVFKHSACTNIVVFVKRINLHGKWQPWRHDMFYFCTLYCAMQAPNCKNSPLLYSGRLSYKATNLGLVFLCLLVYPWKDCKVLWLACLDVCPVHSLWKQTMHCTWGCEVNYPRLHCLIIIIINIHDYSVVQSKNLREHLTTKN